jgi:hypothetical protein
MPEYTSDELKEALRAIASTVSKIEKVREKDTLGSSQRTLIERRLKALNIATDLIQAKLKELQ